LSEIRKEKPKSLITKVISMTSPPFTGAPGENVRATTAGHSQSGTQRSSKRQEKHTMVRQVLQQKLCKAAECKNATPDGVAFLSY